MIGLRKYSLFVIIFFLLTQTTAYGLLVSPETQVEGYFYGSYLGGSGRDDIRDLILDPDGNMIVLGGTFSPDFPIVDAYQDTFGGGVQPEEPPYYGGDGFVAMFSAAGELVWSTFLGGSMLENCERGILVGDEIIVCGVTNSDDLPIVGDVGQVSYGGGMEHQWDCIVDDGYVYVVAQTASSDIITSDDAFMGNYAGNTDGYIFRLSLEEYLAHAEPDETQEEESGLLSSYWTSYIVVTIFVVGIFAGWYLYSKKM